MGNVVIKNIVSADFFRRSAECKNQLINPGDMYVGTGNLNTDLGEIIEGPIYETDVLSCNNGKGDMVLLSDEETKNRLVWSTPEYLGDPEAQKDDSFLLSIYKNIEKKYTKYSWESYLLNNYWQEYSSVSGISLDVAGLGGFSKTIIFILTYSLDDGIHEDQVMFFYSLQDQINESMSSNLFLNQSSSTRLGIFLKYSYNPNSNVLKITPMGKIFDTTSSDLILDFHELNSSTDIKITSFKYKIAIIM